MISELMLVKNSYRVFGQFKDQRARLENDIKIVSETRCEDVNWTEMAQDHVS
jgi:hypothetical protein